MWDIHMVHVKVVKGHKTMHSMLGNGVFLLWVNQSTGSGGAPGMMNDADVFAIVTTPLRSTPSDMQCFVSDWSSFCH